MMMKTVTKPKPNPNAGKLKHVRVEMSDNGGATVHTMHHGATVHDYPSEVNAGAYSTPEEALHAAGKHMGADVALTGIPAAPASQKAMPAKGAGAKK